MMLGKTSLDQAALPRDAASQRNIRFLWTGFGFSVLMLVGASARVLLPTASHASAKAALDAPALFIPTSLRTRVSIAAAKTESEVVRAGDLPRLSATATRRAALHSFGALAAAGSMPSVGSAAETRKKKGRVSFEDVAELPPVTGAEYMVLKIKLTALQTKLQQVVEASQGPKARPSLSNEAAIIAYTVSQEVRPIGTKLCRAIDTKERKEALKKLNLLLDTLGIVDAVWAELATKDSKGNSKNLPAGFDPLGLALSASVRQLSDFLNELPKEPTARGAEFGK